MATDKKNRRLPWLATTAVAALGLAAVSVPLTPAHAQIGVQIGPYGVGVGGPYYGPGPYYGYGPYHHYHHYYGPGYYGW
jgi:hypothetical protein